MPLPFIAVAIPVLHSSGGWIAYASGGYVASTLTSTWIGTFILGNSTLLGSLGLVSGAGIFGAAGGFTALASSAGYGLGAALTSVGLGGVASALGIAPVATFLGLTPIGWTIAGSATFLSALGYYFTKKTMVVLNEKRKEGGLEPITIGKIREEVRLYEKQSMLSILEKLCSERSNISLSNDHGKVTIDNKTYLTNRLKYLISKDGSEAIYFINILGIKKTVLEVKPKSDEHLKN